MGWIFEENRPIYTQLLEQIQMRIICGIYAPGERLPSVRELAQEAAVNPNTMQKSLAELERTKLIYTQRTAGRFVTEDTTLIRGCRRQIAMEKIEYFMRTMQELGYSREEILTLMQQDRELAGECREDGFADPETDLQGQRNEEVRA